MRPAAWRSSNRCLRSRRAHRLPPSPGSPRACRRTGRAGLTGLALSFVTQQDATHWKLIQKRNEVAIELELEAGFEPSEENNDTTDDVAEELHPKEEKFAFTPRVPVTPVVLDPNGGVKGRRPSKKDKLRAQAASENKPGKLSK